MQVVCVLGFLVDLFFLGGGGTFVTLPQFIHDYHPRETSLV